MRILIVASYNHQHFAPFIVEQARALQQQGCEVQFFGVVGKGMRGYWQNLAPLRHVIATFRPHLLHAHYGLCGLLANLQRDVPVVTTYHGSDVNDNKVYPFSMLAMWLSAQNIFVSKRLMHKAFWLRHACVLPCGVSLTDYPFESKADARKRLGWEEDRRYVLFAGAFGNAVKNAPLAQEAVSKLEEVQLVEMKGYTRKQVRHLFYGADAFMMTSFSEGSPQVVKEAMACGCPLVSVDVGDVAERVQVLEGCRVVPSLADALADALQEVMQVKRTAGREQLKAMGLTNPQVARRLQGLYRFVLHRTHPQK